VDELPPGRRVHKLIWVYKVKRISTATLRSPPLGADVQKTKAPSRAHEIFLTKSSHGIEITFSTI